MHYFCLLFGIYLPIKFKIKKIPLKNIHICIFFFLITERHKHNDNINKIQSVIIYIVRKVFTIYFTIRCNVISKDTSEIFPSPEINPTQ